jgi:hypothetical protein
MLAFSLPDISAWAYGVIGLAFTAAVVGLITDWFRRVPSWVWKFIRRGPTPNDPAKQRVRDEKRERLRPRFEKAVDASEKMRESTELAAWGRTQASDDLMRIATVIFRSVRTQLLTEPEGEQIVALYDRQQRTYMEYRVMLQNRDMLREANRPDLPKYAAEVNAQRDTVLAITDELRTRVQSTLKSLEP